jgi:hypothetical protein
VLILPRSIAGEMEFDAAVREVGRRVANGKPIGFFPRTTLLFPIVPFGVTFDFSTLPSYINSLFGSDVGKAFIHSV